MRFDQNCEPHGQTMRVGGSVIIISLQINGNYTRCQKTDEIVRERFIDFCKIPLKWEEKL